jgi:hypothetical protein
MGWGHSVNRNESPRGWRATSGAGRGMVKRDHQKAGMGTPWEVSPPSTRPILGSAGPAMEQAHCTVHGTDTFTQGSYPDCAASRLHVAVWGHHQL